MKRDQPKEQAWKLAHAAQWELLFQQRKCFGRLLEPSVMQDHGKRRLFRGGGLTLMKRDQPKEQAWKLAHAAQWELLFQQRKCFGRLLEPSVMQDTGRSSVVIIGLFFFFFPSNHFINK